MRRGWTLVALLGGCSNGNPPIGPGPSTFDTVGATSGSSSETAASEEEAASDTSSPTNGSESSGPTSTGGSDPPDYAMGTWVFENVSSTPTMGLHGRRAVLETGQNVVAWAEVDPDDLGILNIFAAVQSDADWTFQALTDVEEQNTYPTMVAAGDVAFLAWTGRQTADDDYDIYLAEWNGAAWEPARNLTGVIDPEAFDESQPVMVRRPGSLTVAFTVNQIMPATSEVYVAEFLPDDDPAERELLIPTSQGTCFDLTGAASDDGVAHFVASCGGSLIHATDRSGDWDYDTLGGVGTGVLSPSASHGSDGDVHLVWVQGTPCGTETCEDIFYAKTTDGVFGNPVNVTNTANLNERFPSVGIDPWGRVLVFSQVRLDDLVHLRLSVSEDGGDTFAESVRISPEATLDDHQTPTDVAFDADGLPSFVFEYVVDGSDPLNIDIHLARFEPGA
jgi:hypothetical protein